MSRGFENFFFGGKPVCPFLIPHRPFLLIYSAESGLQRIFAPYNLAGVVNQSAGPALAVLALDCLPL
jgi:hypothetical protein